MERIVQTPKHCGGAPRIRGTRLSVRFIKRLLKSGWTPEYIAEQYPHIEVEDVIACKEYKETKC